MASLQAQFLELTLTLARHWNARARDFDAMDAPARVLGLAAAGAGSAVAMALLVRLSLRASVGAADLTATCGERGPDVETDQVAGLYTTCRRRARKRRAAGRASGSRSVIPFAERAAPVVPATRDEKVDADGGDVEVVSALAAGTPERVEGEEEETTSTTSTATDAAATNHAAFAPYPPRPARGLPIYEEDGYLGTYYIAGDLNAPVTSSSPFAAHDLEPRRQLSPEQCLEGLRRHLTPHVSSGAKKATAAAVVSAVASSPANVMHAAAASPSSFGSYVDPNAFALPDFTDKAEEASSDETSSTTASENVAGSESDGLDGDTTTTTSESLRMRKDLLHRGERSIHIEYHPSQQRGILRPSAKLNFRTPGFGRVRPRANLDGPGWDRSQRQPRAAMSTGKLPPRRSAMNREVALPSPSRNPLRASDASPSQRGEIHVGSRAGNDNISNSSSHYFDNSSVNANAPSPSAAMFASTSPAPASGMRSPCPSPAPSRARQRNVRSKATDLVPADGGDAAFQPYNTVRASGNDSAPRSPSPAAPSPRGKVNGGQRRKGSILGPSRTVGGGSGVGVESKQHQSAIRRVRVKIPHSPVARTNQSTDAISGAASAALAAGRADGSDIFTATTRRPVATPPRQKRLEALLSTPAPHLPSSPAPQRSAAVSRTLSYTPGRLPATSLPARIDLQ